MGNLGGVPGLGNLGLGGFHKKKQQQPQPATQAAGPSGQNWVVLMESSIETTNFSSASIDPSLFAVPAGYTKVPSEYQEVHQ
jgi:hypothetical protein